MKLFGRNKSLLFLGFLGFFVAGCASFSGSSSIEKRIELANSIATKAGMKEAQVATGSFILTTYYKIADTTAPLTVYIEGDGFAWASRHRLSSNPTPIDAFTLRLAGDDPAPNVVYIARPCQYTPLVPGDSCAPQYWSGSRFAEEVIVSVNKAVSHYAGQMENPHINLIGYSGGAAVAVLIAARRSDIATLRTVAGNLNHTGVNQYHGVDNLDNSLNPIDVSEKIGKLPQYHFVGAEDTIIPLSIVSGFAKKAEQGMGCISVQTVEGATHYSGWQEKWPELLRQPVTCKSIQISKKNK